MMNRVGELEYRNIEKECQDRRITCLLCRLVDDVPNSGFGFPGTITAPGKVQHDIQKTRTDLDRFSQPEIDLLLRLGFLVAQEEWKRRRLGRKLTDSALASPAAAAFPPEVIQKLNPLKEKEFEWPEQFSGALSSVLTADEMTKYQADITSCAEPYTPPAYLGAAPWSPVPVDERCQRDDGVASAKARWLRLFSPADPFSWAGLALGLVVLAALAWAAVHLFSSRTRINGDLSFDNGTLLERAIDEIKSEGSGPCYIITDYASFGSFSFPEKFQRYRDAIIERHNKAKDKTADGVRCIFMNGKLNTEFLKRQFADEKDDKKREEAFQKFLLKKKKQVRDYLSSDYVKNCALIVLKTDDPEQGFKTLTLEKWIEICNKVEDEVIEQLKDAGVWVRFVPYELSVHIWSSHHRSAVASFVSFRDLVDERGVQGSGDFALEMRKVAADLASGKSLKQDRWE
jgi:hypothetical protein